MPEKPTIRVSVVDTYPPTRELIASIVCETVCNACRFEIVGGDQLPDIVITGTNTELEIGYADRTIVLNKPSFSLQELEAAIKEAAAFVRAETRDEVDAVVGAEA